MCTPERMRGAPPTRTLACVASLWLGSVAAPLHAAPPEALPPTVHADGTGLPPGGGTADAGAPLYAARCASCHGEAGEGARALELVGDRSLIDSDRPDRGIAVHWPYAPPLYDYVRRAMPPDAPWSLTADETYAVVARVLELNGLLDAHTRVDADFLSTLAMPNADGFEDATEERADVSRSDDGRRPARAIRPRPRH